MNQAEKSHAISKQGDLGKKNKKTFRLYNVFKKGSAAMKNFDSVTNNSNSLKLFSNRENLIFDFVSRVNDEPIKEAIYFYHGEGGNGKTLLMRYLKDNYCNIYPNKDWERIKLELRNDQQKIIRFIKDRRVDGSTEFPSVYHDFSQVPQEKENPQDPFYGLIFLRRKFITAAKRMKYKVKLPLFDFACIMYMYKNYRSVEEIKRLFPFDELSNLIITIIDTIFQLPVGAIGKCIFDLFENDLSLRSTLYLSKRNIKKEDIEFICQLDSEKELIQVLPDLLAQDINLFMDQENSPKRFSLFFDAYESFIGDDRGIGYSQSYFRDQWFRRLILGLNKRSGIIISVSGRSKPIWSSINELLYPVPIQLIEYRRLKGLTRNNSIKYLNRCIKYYGSLGSFDEIIKISRTSKNNIHPLYLGLLVDVIRSIGSKNYIIDMKSPEAVEAIEQKTEYIVDYLLLKYAKREVRDMIRSLSACRRFNENIFYLLGKACHFKSYKADYDTLIEFSFVHEEKTYQEESSYRIHSLIRNWYNKYPDKSMLKAHQTMRLYYKEYGNKLEEIYHLNHVDWTSGMESWIKLISKYLSSGEYDKCRDLIQLRTELFMDIRYSGIAHYFEGIYYLYISEYTDSINSLTHALSYFDSSLTSVSNDTEILSYKGETFKCLGDVRSCLSESKAAIENYNSAISIFSQISELVPKGTKSKRNQGDSLKSLGDHYFKLGQFDTAINYYSSSIYLYDTIIRKDSQNVSYLNVKGTTLKYLADVYCSVSNKEAATKKYCLAISTFDIVLKLEPNNFYALHHKGTVLKGLADQFLKFGQTELSIKNYTRSIEAYSHALMIVPEKVSILYDKAIAYKYLGDAQSCLSDENSAISNYNLAISILSTVLKRVPSSIGTHHILGTVFKSLADSYFKMNCHRRSIQNYLKAIEAYDFSLLKAPDDILVLNDKGTAYKFLADVQNFLPDKSPVVQNYNLSISIFKKALKISSKNISIHHNMGTVYKSLGDYFLKENNNLEDAILNYRSSVDEYNIALLKAPNDHLLLRNKKESLKAISDTLKKFPT